MTIERTRANATILAAGLVALAALATPVPVAAQDANILLPVDTVERLLKFGDFEILDRRGSRFQGDRTSRVALQFNGATMMVVKWAPAPRGGDADNNSPRYEMAAYELQKMFLEPHEFVVPPTVIRAFDLPWYRTLDPDARPTFEDTRSVLVALQYWLFNIAGDDFYDRRRLDSDSVYARHLGNFNVFTYVARHNDQNMGNYLISSVESNPRVFSVDNGLAFHSRTSDQGADWRQLRVRRLPVETVERLRTITRADLQDQLGTLAQFEVRSDGTLTLEPSGPAIDPRRGIRTTETVIQLGLTEREIDDVWRRIQRLLDRVDDGDLETF
ncbi:MAG: hypothetical protein R3324_09850 [Halobacteriales archaeon]|nr:hypothetical protein [Halobacteriales archaeon]